MEFDIAVKLQIYRTISETANAPDVAEVAEALAYPVSEVESAFQRLAEKRLLVLDENDPSTIIMAPPFSGVETPFRAKINEKSYFANCIWDALGVSAALHKDALVQTICGDCNEPMALQIRDGKPLAQECAVHFAVPAAHWWDDIVYT